MNPKEKIHFVNLDGLRFIGSMIIVLIHTERLKVKHGDECTEWVKPFEIWGGSDVSLFFVLSGFLITYLLLKEKQISGNINLKDFYIRRILKIWPLYYFIMIVGFFLLPLFSHGFYNNYSNAVGDHFWIGLLTCMLFLPPLFALPESIGPTWSVRVEEAFYAFWPLIVRKSNNFVRSCCLLILLVVVVRTSTYHFQELHFLSKVCSQYRVSCMAIGGIMAYILINNKQRILSFLYRIDVQIITYTILLVLLLTRTFIPFVNHEVYAVLFAFMVLNLAANPRSVININYRWMNYLGSLSYGLYLYHPVMQIISMEVVEHMFNQRISGWEMNIIYYSFTISSTIGISILSYKFLEKPFLNMKKRFTTIST